MFPNSQPGLAVSPPISRLQFLRGDFAGRKQSPMPPWSLPWAAFERTCDRCHACVAGCPTDILRVGGGRLPEVDFSRGECTFCGECVARCRPGALVGGPAAGATPWMLVAAIGEGCLARKGMMCMTCAERCPTRAIRFRPPLPALDPSACNGCGACVAPCPSQAIQMRPKGPEAA